MKLGLSRLPCLLLVPGQAAAAPPAATHHVSEDLHRRAAARSGAAIADRFGHLSVAREGGAEILAAGAQPFPSITAAPRKSWRPSPDLILTDPFMAPALRPLLAKTGARIVEVPPAENFDADPRRHPAGGQGGGRGGARRGADRAHGCRPARAGRRQRPQKTLTVAGWGTGGYVPGTRRPVRRDADGGGRRAMSSAAPSAITMSKA